MGLKPIVIELPEGLPSQPMTCSRVQGTWADVQAELERIKMSLEAAGYVVTRLKVEAAPWNREVPQDDAAAALSPENNYFEHHLKLLLPAGADVARLEQIYAQHSAHLSHNAFKGREDGQQERFVTSRFYGIGLEAAQAKTQALTNALQAADITTLKTVMEYCLFDSNLELDAGWGVP